MSDLPYPPFGAAARLSNDGLYRYELTRRWAGGACATWIMLNPSTADATQDDATIRRCIGFAKGWAMGAICVVNLFAFRATHPQDLRLRRSLDVDIVGPGNDDAIHDAVVRSRLVVAAWGTHGAGERARRVAEMVTQDIGRDLWCLGTTKSGQPCHPLRLPASTEPRPYAVS